MAPKVKTKKKKKQKEETSSSSTMAERLDFPQKLEDIMKRQWAVRERINYGGQITKFWRAPISSKCNQIKSPPCLQLFDHEINYNDNNKRYSCWWYDERIPMLMHVRTYSASKSNLTMVLTGISHPAFIIGRDWDWVKQDCTLTEPRYYCSMMNSKRKINNIMMIFTNAIGFFGGFYALSLQGTLAVIDASNGSHPKITALSSERAVPSLMPKYFRECLLESKGNVLLVFLNFRKSIKVVDDVEVFQLNKEKLSWVKMTSLGDITLFLGTNNLSISVSASSIGCRRNCIYFINDIADGWWVFDMAKGCVSPGWTDATTKAPDWTKPI